MELSELGELAQGIIEHVGPATVKPELVPNPKGNGQLAVVRNGYSLQQLDGPKRKRREHVFHDVGSYAAWMNRHAKDRAGTVEILADREKVVAALEPENALGDIVVCNLGKHPSFLAWSGIFGKAMNQKALHSFVRGNLDAFPHSENAMGGDILAAELQKLNVKSTSELAGDLDAKGFYKFSSTGGKTELSGQIPPQFTIEIPVFIDVRNPATDAEMTYSLTVLLSMDIGDQVAFMLSCPSLPLIQHQARLDAIAWLRNLLDPAFLVGLGEIKLQEVYDVQPEATD